MKAENEEQSVEEQSIDQLPEMLEVWQETLTWQPSQCQQARFQRLYELVLAGNRQFNLTRIIEPIEFWEKHLWDSLVGVRHWLASSDREEIQLSLRAIDIGTGAGFPGLPMAIACPNWTITLMDSTRKKIVFLDTLVTTLGVENAKTWCDRAEQVGQHPQHREAYDLALVRAVASAAVCAEYALPLVKIGGSVVLYRGQLSVEEMEVLERAVQSLGGAIESIEAFKTPLSESVRHCLYLKKTTATLNEFPRAIGIPVQNPLGEVVLDEG
jgi:16S rRNA (guanine527-N7)-methyltransferase